MLTIFPGSAKFLCLTPNHGPRRYEFIRRHRVRSRCVSLSHFLTFGYSVSRSTRRIQRRVGPSVLKYLSLPTLLERGSVLDKALWCTVLALASNRTVHSLHTKPRSAQFALCACIGISVPLRKSLFSRRKHHTEYLSLARHCVIWCTALSLVQRSLVLICTPLCVLHCIWCSLSHFLHL